MKQFSLVTAVIVLSLLLTAGVPAKLSLKNTDDISEMAKYGQNSNIGILNLSNTLPEGFHDANEGLQNQFSCVAEGWAVDPDDRDIDLTVKIYSDGDEVAQVTASNFRQDLEDADVCMGGTCSFSVDLWSLISHDVDHVISIQALDAQTNEWVNLSDTPKMLNCAEPHAQTFIVNSTADAVDANWGNGICETFTAGECTLRAAIEEANANSGLDTINFNIPGFGPQTISPSYGFDYIFDPMIIDGTTQPGFAGSPIIELDGSNAGTDAYGIVIFAGSSEVRGLVINRFNLTGLDIHVNGGNIIQGNYIGTDITGTIDLGNGVNGISISKGSSNNKIGGTAPEARNIISGNGEFGIIIVDSGSTGNVIKGNFIGTDISGTIDLGNSSVGVIIGLGASQNVVGGTEAGSLNLISGNDSAGVQIAETGSTGNIILGNYIGTDLTGTLALGNVYEGIFIAAGATDNVVGGNVAGAGNLISGNNGNGITIADIGTTGNLVQGNYIGTDATGTIALGNADDGVVLLAPNNTIGGTTSKARNVISGNEGQGVRLQGTEASGNIVEGNFIGTDVTGTFALGNGTECCHSGLVLHLGASNNTIGGMAPGAGNVISANTFDGITIIDIGTSGNIIAGNLIGTDLTGTLNLGNSLAGVLLYGDVGTGNIITSNSIHTNGGLGIDLGADGVTLNDLFDWESGPNNLQNFPVITAAKANGATTSVNIKLSSTPNTTFRIELFSTTVCDPSGYGEGNTFLGFVDVTTNAGGQANVKVTLTMSLPVGSFLTTTATDPDGNTSEFSQCKIVNQSQ